MQHEKEEATSRWTYYDETEFCEPGAGPVLGCVFVGTLSVVLLILMVVLRIGFSTS
jgi:hypothetical protein